MLHLMHIFAVQKLWNSYGSLPYINCVVFNNTSESMLMGPLEHLQELLMVI